MDSEKRECYVRWQDYRVTQLSYSINLFLGFAVASLAYAISLKFNDHGSDIIPLNKVLMWWGLSAVIGCLATISKLLDYRHTARKIKDGGRLNEFISHWCGRTTWWLFWAQLSLYAIGAYLFIVGVICA